MYQQTFALATHFSALGARLNLEKQTARIHSPQVQSETAVSREMILSSDDGQENNEATKSLDELLPLVYPELRRLAARYFRKERRAHTLQPTALVHEVYLRLAGSNAGSWSDRAQFLAHAAKAMRRVLIDHARRRNAEKREGGLERVMLELVDRQGAAQQLDLLALHEALARLEREEPVKCQVVELRFLGGLSVEETAEMLGISTGTVKRYWTSARAWLFRELHGDSSGTDP